MFDANYCLLDENNLSATKAGNGFNRLWFPHTPVVIEAAATGTVSGSTTCKIQESDNNSSYTDICTITISAAGKQRKRILVSKKYVRANITAAGSVGHLTVSVVPAGEFTDPK